MQAKARTLSSGVVATLLLLLLTGSGLVRGAERTVVVGTKSAAPFAMPGNGTGPSWSGLSIELWERLADQLGIAYEYREYPLAQLLDEVKEGNLDLAVAALTVTAEREQIVDFSHPYFQSSLGVAVPRAPATGALAGLTALVSAEFLQAVAVLLLILLAVGVLAWLAERKRNVEQFGGSPLQGIGSGFWWSAVTMTTVGYGDKAPSSLAGRVLAVVWMFTSIIIIAGITGAIASAFTVQSLQSGIESLDDVLQARSGTVANSTSETFLQDAGARPLAYATLPAALDALAGGEVTAVVYDTPVLKHQIAVAHSGELTVLPLEFRKEYYAIALPEGSAMLEPLNRALLEFVTSPEWDNIRRRYLGE